ncbi:hypothetical protein [Catenuloplanes japonicus]|uniref:hypothetical protein n=1 Tax=Catenuloplanes japonicus TaxID=33876 RepID=UPI00069095A6|nr:hypothetical protein [Catenuloplanes japonicus]
MKHGFAWLRAGLIVLAAFQTFVAAWQYFLTRSFYDDFPTVSMEPPFNQHLLGDVGGLGLALAAMTWYAAYSLHLQAVFTALSGFAVFAITHWAYHMMHFEGFAPSDAIAVGSGLGIEVVLTIVLLLHAYRLKTTTGHKP